MNGRPSQRGLVIVVVLVIITMGALAAAVSLRAGAAASEGASAAPKRAQARALAWSGLQALMVELARQREDLVNNSEPEVTAEWHLELDGGWLGVVRLVPVDETGLRLVSESAKLNINTADADALARLNGGDEAWVRDVISGRPTSGYQSVEDAPAAHRAVASDLTRPGPEPDARSLASMLTAVSADANIQVGLGDLGQPQPMARRINLNVPWSRRLGRALRRRFDDNAAQAVQGLLRDQQVRLESLGDLIRKVPGFSEFPPEVWEVVFDTFSATEDEYLPGLIDINRAPAEVLVCLPGVDELTAQHIVQARETVSAADRRSVTWLVREGVLDAEQFAGVVDFVTTRSLQWRVRLEVGLVLADDAMTEFEGIGGDVGGTDLGTVELDASLVLDAVIDIASLRPRIAYLRDVTMDEDVRSWLGEGAIDVAGAGLRDDLSSGATFGDELAIDDLEIDDLDLPDLDLPSLSFDEPPGGEFGASDPGPRTPQGNGGSARTPARETDGRVGRWNAGGSG